MAGKKRLLSEDPVAFLKALGKDGIPFVVVGGAALALHGFPRGTLDIDIVVPAQEDVVGKLSSQLKRTGLVSKQTGLFAMASRPDLLAGQWVTLEDAQGREWIDLFFEDPRIFKGLLKRSVLRKSRLFHCNVASLKDIEKMKKAVGRPIDWADIALIREGRRRANKGRVLKLRRGQR